MMPGKTKSYDVAADAVDRLRRRMRRLFLRDGRIEEWEQELLDLADGAHVQVAEVGVRVRICQRWLGGGMVAGSLLLEVRDWERRLDELMQEKAPARLQPAEAGGDEKCAA